MEFSPLRRLLRWLKSLPDDSRLVSRKSTFSELQKQASYDKNPQDVLPQCVTDFLVESKKGKS